MELETDNPEKGELLRRSAEQRQLLEDEVKRIAERSEKILTNALVIGGALALTYFLVSGLSQGTKKKRKARKNAAAEGQSGNQETEWEEPHETSAVAGLVTQIGSVLATQATAYLLSIAREKLAEYLQSQAIRKQQEDGDS